VASGSFIPLVRKKVGLWDHSADSVTAYSLLLLILSQLSEIHKTWTERYVPNGNPNVVLLNLVQQQKLATLEMMGSGTGQSVKWA
jgi:hypothetical protein